MNEALKKLAVKFFRTPAGTEPVREWLLSLPEEERQKIGRDILKVQYCWPIGKPLVDGLGHGLWEVRSKCEDRIGRVIFYVAHQQMIILHGFIKKTQKTPQPELELARKRKQLHESLE